MGQFDHYPDMNRDGKHDLYDCVTYIDLMEEDEQAEPHMVSSSEPIRPRDLTAEQREEIRLQRQSEEAARWILIAVFAIIAFVCFKNINGFTVLLGLFSVVAIIRALTL
ncbi:MAG: hypothetical protein IKU72_05350 [Oscillospiraceae bacterium]|nr:hypothetical protein [Oscillospiraceae bacterium]